MGVSSWLLFQVSDSCPFPYAITNVVAGVGTRDYYRKLGYELDGPYMSKSLL